MKVNINLLKMNLILVYPIINIVVCFISKGDNMTILAMSYSVLLAFFILYSSKIRKDILYIMYVLVITMVISFYREKTITDMSSCIAYSIAVIFFLLYSENYTKLSDIKQYFNQSEKKFLIVQLGYFLVLGVHVKLYGLTAGWNTYVLQGPYYYPHTLSYILLFFLIANVYFWLENKSKIALFCTLICEGGIVLTAVRTIIVTSMFVIFYIIYNFIDKKKFLKLICILFIGMFILFGAYKLGLFNSLIEKTELALLNSTLTNGRGNIVDVSLKGWINCKMEGLQYFIGMGMSNLLSSNMKLLNASIHAHNDLIDVLVCYGVINMLIYVHSMVRFAKKRLIWIVSIIGVLAFSNGLFPYLDCIPMLIYCRLLFERKTNYGKGELE